MFVDAALGVGWEAPTRHYQPATEPGRALAAPQSALRNLHEVALITRVLGTPNALLTALIILLHTGHNRLRSTGMYGFSHCPLFLPS